ncbi:MBL fold metallo-hydrolase [Prevotella veroralis]|uniref:Metallo-beta-lactamase domain protein n=1 Tax=Prevotella veroralis F0319 TaxID=649761 RepID=C9MQJ4_9BACT|nr:MBL fold metallo-hydrolase [Prevotella veroralis]EEX18109.1 metallo-beta-lactamase domain protein [Prevotella veroralis F0319]QUB41346.1 MBL fold metallo-hydrolase [Prevotella veroralis]
MLKIQTFEVNPLHENCYVVSDDTKECVIIDCGAFTESEQEAIITYINKNGLKPVHNIGTHGHLDHHFGDAAILSAFNLLPEVSDGDEILMQHSKEAALQMLGMDLNIDLPAGELRLTENNTISFGSHTFRIIRTPGHSRGSVSFYCAEENVLFTGDTLFKGSIGRTDFPGGSMFQIISSLRELAQLPDTTIVYPGHGPQTSIGFELAHNPYMDR